MKNTIAVCGVQARIGTTTQALQLVGYLQMMGYTVAYVELSGRGYIDNVRKLYRDVSLSGECVSYEQIEMYRSVVDIKADEVYDFLVKDYGSMSEASFNRVSFLEQDIQIICGGVKPNEIFKVNEILKIAEYHPARFIFSFVPPDQRDGITKLMTNRADRTFYANYNPDPFVYDATMNKSYRQILGKHLNGVSGTERKKRLQMMKNTVRYRIQSICANQRARVIVLIIYTVFVACMAVRVF